MTSVSIIVPIYNVSRYIGRCLHSVISQTYAGPMECILVDDRGTDDSMARARGIIDVYDGPVKFTILTHERNLGLSEARNSGIRAAGGDYLLFLDSDDELIPDAVDLLADRVERHPGVDMVYGQYYNPPYDSSNDQFAGPDFFSGNEECRRAMLRFRFLPVYVHNKLVRRGFVLDNGLFFEPGLLIEDNLWIWDASRCISTLAVISDATYVYYCNSGSIMNNRVHSTRRIESWLRILGRQSETLEAPCLSEQMRHAMRGLLNVDSDIRYILDGDERHRALKRVREIAANIGACNLRALDLRTGLSLACLNLELRMPFSVDSRLYWLLHRAAKMFVVWPRK